MKLSFYQATSALISTPRAPISRIAQALRRDPHTIIRARMRGENARNAPAGWRPVLAHLALEHATELEDRAKLLRALARLLTQSEKTCDP